MIKSYLKVIAENAQTLQKLADSEAEESTTEEATDLDEPSSSQDDQSSQSTSE